MQGRAANIVSAGLLLLLATAILFAPYEFPPPGQANDPGTAAFPQMLAAALGVLAVAQLVQGPRGGVEALPRGGDALRVVGVVVLLVLYAGVLEALGFILASVLFLFGALLLAEVRGPLPLVLIPVGVSVTLFYVFFVLLRVSLPRSVLERLIS